MGWKIHQLARHAKVDPTRVDYFGSVPKTEGEAAQKPAAALARAGRPWVETFTRWRESAGAGQAVPKNLASPSIKQLLHGLSPQA